MSPNRCPSRRMRATSARLSPQPLVRFSFTLFASLLLILGATPLALLGPVTTAYAQTVGTLMVRLYDDNSIRNGVHDAGEPLVGGSLITVYSADNISVRQNSTNITDTVTFNDLPFGYYRVEVTAPTTPTLMVVSVPRTLGSSATPTNPGLVFRVQITSSTPLSFDVGLRTLPDGSAAGTRVLDTRVWDDLNADGLQNADEPGMTGLTVQLFDDSAPTIAILTASEVPDLAGATSGGGRYLFENAPITSTYKIRVVSTIPTTYTLTKQVAGSPQSNSDGIRANLPLYGASVSSSTQQGANNDSIDLGFTRGAIRGFVFRDANRDGVYDAIGDTRLDGVKVELWDASQTTLLTTTTTRSEYQGETGIYNFTGLITGTYTVVVSGTEFTSGKALLGAANSPNNVASSGDLAGPDGVVDNTVGVTIPVTLDFTNVLTGSNRVTDQNFGFYKSAVGDFVWYDLNRNGLQDEAGGGQSGILLFADTNSNGIRDAGEITSVTQTDGSYLFDNLPLGSAYTITLDPANFLTGAILDGIAVSTAISATNSLTQTYYYTTTSVLTTTSRYMTADFGLTRAELGNFVFEDANGNGYYDIGDSPIPTVTVELYRTAGVTLTAAFTTTTDSSGVYTIPNLPAINYYAVFDLATAGAPYTNTKFVASPQISATVDPAETTAGDYSDLITTTLTPATRWRTPNFRPVSGIVNKGVDAGFYQITTITGTAFFDTNNDGVDAATPEPGMRGVTVSLLRTTDSSEVVSATTPLTDSTGIYTLTNVPPGAYTVKFVNPVSTTFSLITGTTDVSPTKNLYNSDVELVGPATGNGQTGYVTVTSGIAVGELDAGFRGKGTVSGRAFLDNDGSDTQNTGDTDLSDVTAALTVTANLLNLVTAPYSVGVSVTAGVDPNYSFAALPFDGSGGTGVTYTLDFAPPNTTYLTSTANVGSDDAVDSDGPSLIITQTNLTNDYDQGYYQEAQVTARVFNETTSPPNNMFNDAGASDVGLDGVTVYLKTITGTLSFTQTTLAGNSGLVTYTVKPGSYHLDINESTGLTGLTRSPGWTNPLTVTGNPLLSNGTSNTDAAGANSFGYYTPATVTGTVFFDRNLDNQLAGEPGVQNVDVQLAGATGTVTTTTTTATGAYTFTNVPADNYTLTFTNPDTLNFSFILSGTTPLPNDSDLLTGGAVPTSTIDVGAVAFGASSGGHDAGLVGNAAVGGMAFVDGNANGVSGELSDGRLPGVTVTLSLDVNIPGTLTTQVTRTMTTTGGTGVYTFTKLPGDPDTFLGSTSTAVYSLTFTPPAPSWLLTTADVGDTNPSLITDTYTLDSDSELLGQQLDRGAADARDQGYSSSTTITGTVFFDRNLDNQLAGEPGVQGVAVQLDGTSGTVGVTTTDALGVYTFTNVPGDNYTLTFTNPDTLNFSFILSGTTPLPNDSELLTGGAVTTSTIDVGTVAFGASSGGHDAGLVGTAAMGGTAFVDGNANGQSNDAGIDGRLDGVTVTLTLDVKLNGFTTQITRTAVTTYTTAISGTYAFTGLPGAGATLTNTAAYSLTFTAPITTTPWLTTTTDVTDTNILTDTSTTDSDGPLQLRGQQLVRNTTASRDQGYYQNVTISARVFNELVGSVDNQYQNGDAGIGSVQVALELLSDGTPVETRTTELGTGLVTYTVKPGSYRFNIDGTAAPLSSLIHASIDWADPTPVFNNPLTSGATSATDSTGRNSFGYYQLATITGTVFFDRDLNNQLAGEPGVQSVQLQLNGATGSVSTTTTTGTGAYTFTNLVSDTYTLVITNPDKANFSFITKTLALSNDSDAVVGGAVTTSTINVGLVPYGASSGGHDAGVIGNSTANGMTFVDGNVNGLSNDGGGVDGRLAGATVTLTLDVNISNVLTTRVTRTAVTASTAAISGTYSFAGLPGAVGGALGGTSAYSLTFVVPTATPAWQMTQTEMGGSPNESINSDSDRSNLTLSVNITSTRDVGYYQNVTITGRVFEELVGIADNDYAVGDRGISGMSVALEDTTGTSIQSQTSDGTGVVTFTNIPPGVAYQLRLNTTGITPTLLTSPGFTTNPLPVAGGSLLSGQTSRAGATAGANSFGYYTPASISGRVFFDRNLDNLLTGEPGVQGVTVTLLAGTTVKGTATTDATGAYTFPTVVADNYTLTFTNPDTANFAFFTGGDSLVTTGGAVAASSINLGAVGSGGNATGNNAGLVGKATVSGMTFVDANFNGLSNDAVDGRLAGATVTLTLDVTIPNVLTTQIVRSTSTAATTGAYSFTGLPGATGTATYNLSFTAPTVTPAWNLTTAEVGDTNSTADTSTTDSDNELSAQTLTPGGADVRDQGYYQNATVLARIFDEQVTVNGIFELGEVGISGSAVTITPTTILTGGGNSDSAGLITYTVKPGVYTVTRPAVMPAGFTPSLGTVTSVVVTVTSGLAGTAEFGYFKPSALAGTTWFDSSGNGLVDPNEPGMEGITVTLQTGAGSTLVAPVRTDIAGTYVIPNVLPNVATGAPADYRLCFSTTADFTYTARTGVTTTDNNSDANVTTGCTDPFQVVASNTVITTTDAGYRGLASIGDLVWSDINSDGIQDPTENGVAGAVVTLAISTTGNLINTNNPTLVLSATSVASLNLAANYAVTGIPPAAGFRVVSVTPPLGSIPAPTHQGTDPATDSNAAGDTGGAIPPSVTDLDFGFTGVTTVGGRVWLDLNGNGLYDTATETGLPDVKVELLDGTTVVSATTTFSGTEAGLYAFEALPPGTYSLRFIPPTGYGFSNDGSGSITTDGDNDARNDGTTVSFTMIGGQQLFTVGAGIAGTGGVSGLAWMDDSRNNVRDPSETRRLAGVQVLLNLVPTLMPDRPLLATTTTASDGSYSFAKLPAGTAVLTFTAPAKYAPVTANVGSDALDSDGPVVVLDIVADTVLSNVDTGYRERGLMTFLPMVNGRIARAELSGRLTLTPAKLEGYVPAQVAVTVVNTGEAPATNFWVDLYINPSRVPVVNDRWNDICGSLSPCLGMAWYYTGVLQPGQSVTLVSTETSATNPNGYEASASVWPGYFIDGTSKIYVFVDSWNRNASGTIRNPNGAVEEQNEANNLIEQNVTVSPRAANINPALLNQDLIDPDRLAPRRLP